MESVADFPILFALLNGYELVTILALVLVFFGGKHIDDFRRGLGQGCLHLRHRIDEIGEEAGRTVGYNYAKPVHEAITHDNQNVEFHDPRELRPILFKLWKLAKKTVKNFC